MICLVKSESFREFELAYNAYFSETYAVNKKRELELQGRRILETKKEFISLLMRKGITLEKTLDFVDSVRRGYLNDNGFIRAYQYACISTTAVVELINDLDFERVWELLKICSANKNDVCEETLRELIFLTGMMSEVMIDSYSLLSLFGAYDNWCSTEPKVLSTCRFFSDLAFIYEKQILAVIEDTLIKSGEYPDEAKRQKKEAMALMEIFRNTNAAHKYGVDIKVAQMYSLLKHLIDLIDGQCEWFWNED